MIKLTDLTKKELIALINSLSSIARGEVERRLIALARARAEACFDEADALIEEQKVLVEKMKDPSLSGEELIKMMDESMSLGQRIDAIWKKAEKYE